MLHAFVFLAGCVLFVMTQKHKRPPGTAACELTTAPDVVASLMIHRSGFLMRSLFFGARRWQVSPGGCGFNGATESLEGKRECTGGCRALRRCAQAELRREATQPHLQGRRPLGAGGEHVFIFFPSPSAKLWGGTQRRVCRAAELRLLLRLLLRTTKGR